MKNYRLTYSKLDQHGIHQVIFTTIIQAKSMRGAKQKARNLEPFEWDGKKIIDLSYKLASQLDKLEFNY
jgi:hypothetical protein